MVDLLTEDAALTPEVGDTAFDLFETAFAAAPVDNRDGSTGIDLFITVDDNLPNNGQQLIFDTAGIGVTPAGPDGDLTNLTLFSGDGSTITAASWDFPIDWNGNSALEASTALNVNGFPNSDCDAGDGSDIAGHNDWQNLQFGFRASLNYASGARVRVTEKEFIMADCELVSDAWDKSGTRLQWSVKLNRVPKLDPK